MDFELSDEQVLLRDSTRGLLARSYDPESRNKVVDTELGWSRDVWGQLAEIGILGLTFETAEVGPIETMLALAEVGRRLAPEPVIAAALTPGVLIAQAGSEQQRHLLERVASGQTMLAFAHDEPGMRWPAIQPATKAVPDGGSWAITGRKNPVLAGDCADTLVVSATLPGGAVGLFLVAADAVTRHKYRTFDGQRGAQVDFDEAVAEPLGQAVGEPGQGVGEPGQAVGQPGQAGDAANVIRNAIIRTQSALCAEAVGAMEEALRLTTEYLKARKQFGVTLNKFQALTQRAADMYVSLEMARSMNMYAAMSIADGNLDPVIASRAKLAVGQAARHIGQEAVQLHGGIGMTAEYPVGHYLARLTAIEQTLGASDDHLRVLIDRLGDYDVATL
ncbi:MAG: acyl-CoA dehydrogenase family protein [Mycobacteriaceae bacterium]|nr:acyl-CoA dehydrogenase family protein [Mycobacteriaceae bacterium]